jgi:hypothetical protein
MLWLMFGTTTIYSVYAQVTKSLENLFLVVEKGEVDEMPLL